MLSSKRTKRVKNAITAILALGVVICTPLNVQAANISNVTANTLSRQAIDALVEKNITPFGWEGSPMTYDQKPSWENGNYIAGKVSNQNLQEALNMANTFRAVAGVPGDLTLDPTYTDYSQHAAVANMALGDLQHSLEPSWFPGMSNDFYAKASFGSARSNLSMGYNTIFSSLYGYMYDGDWPNTETVGHRKALLNPKLPKTGFGNAGTVSSMYIADNGKESSDYEAITWPAKGDFPIELFMVDPPEISGNVLQNNNYIPTPWSITLNEDIYLKPDINDLKITLTRNSDSKKWKFDASDNKQNDKFLNVDRNTIIFRPNMMDMVYPATVNDTFSVKVEGLTKYTGEVTLEYDVHFYEYLRKYTANGSSPYVDTSAQSVRRIYPGCTAGEVATYLKNYHNPGFTYTLTKDGTTVSNDTKVTSGMMVEAKHPTSSNNWRYPIIIKGDADKDGMITMKDFIKIRNYALDIDTAFDAIQLKTSDLNCDNAINMKDIIMIRNALVFDQIIPQ